MSDPRTPCIVGVAQRTHRPDQGDSPEPLDCWETMSRAAAADSGGNDVLGSVDACRVVYPMSWQYDDAPARLAERLGLGEGERFYSGLSGTTPQALVGRAGAEILAGEREMVLIASGESLATKKRLKKAGERPAWSHPPAEKRGMPFDDPFHPSEIAHGIFQAYLTFAMFDIARRAHRGTAPDAYRGELGELLASLTRVAAKNPNAWFQKERSASELIEVSVENRMVAYPYAKNMVSIMDIDMSAAILVTSQERADALGIPGDRRVYLRGWAAGQDPVRVAEREDLGRSAAMREASQAAMQAAGVGIDDIAHLDLYSCFGSSLGFAADALGIPADGSRPLTVTGGLPYFGGPGNGYVSHSIVTMVERLREEPDALGMLSGVGMHMQNHVYGVYSATPSSVKPPDAEAIQQRIDAAQPKRRIENSATGSARIATYTVLHGREGFQNGVAVCDLPDGARAYAKVEDEATMRSMEAEEWVGREIDLEDAGDGVNRIRV